jgi:galactokinase
MQRDELRAAFAARFGYACRAVARAPGRVNLIGEHTDYNEGFVLPIATPHATWVAVGAPPAGRAADRDPELRACSATLDDMQTWAAGKWSRAGAPHWTSYIAGVAEMLRRRGLPVAGFDLLIDSDLPLGAGLSSSAALSVATALWLASLVGASLSREEIAPICRAAEHEFAGVPCGVMDQYASLFCQENHALLLDCRNLQIRQVPLRLDGHTFLVINSGVKHELASSEYAKRQQQCATAVAHFRQADPAIRSLRDVTESQVAAEAARMPAEVAARARHVTSENRRTLSATEALERGDVAHFGRLMYESHLSLQLDYEVSCAELDLLIELLAGVPGVLGARMTGGGFGGSVVALAQADAVDPVRRELHQRYDTTDRQAALILVRPSAGASVTSGEQ